MSHQAWSKRLMDPAGKDAEMTCHLCFAHRFTPWFFDKTHLFSDLLL